MRVLQIENALQALHRMFDKVDTSGDKQIGWHEFNAALKARSYGAPHRRAAETLR